MTKKYNITIDTNCINVRKALDSLNKLEEWHSLGLIEIVKTDVMDTELRGDARLEKSSKLNEDLGVGVWDHSRWGHAVWGGEDVHYRLEEIKKVIFPDFNKLTEKRRKNATRDAMHLATHLMHNRDFFVTLDKQILSKKEDLLREFNVEVLSPEQCVEKLKGLISK